MSYVDVGAGGRNLVNGARLQTRFYQLPFDAVLFRLIFPLNHVEMPLRPLYALVSNKARKKEKHRSFLDVDWAPTKSSCNWYVQYPRGSFFLWRLTAFSAILFSSWSGVGHNKYDSS